MVAAGIRIRHGFGRVAEVEIALGHELERTAAPTISQHCVAHEAGRTLPPCRGERSRRLEDRALAGFVTGEETIIRRPRCLDHNQPHCCAAKVIEIDPQV